MKEKVVLARPNGEITEKEVICHFKSIDDIRPNIKNVPILVVDKKETNNGNQVLEFYWEKDGLYQGIIDDVAWSEVKSVIIDIIKVNFSLIGINEVAESDNSGKSTRLVYLEAGDASQGMSLSAAIGDGRNLALSVAQVEGLSGNFKSQVINLLAKQSAAQEMIQTPINEVSESVINASNQNADGLLPENNVSISQPVISENIASPEVNSTFENDVQESNISVLDAVPTPSQNVVNQVNTEFNVLDTNVSNDVAVNSIPAVDNINLPEIPIVSQVEIVSNNNQGNNFDLFVNQILEVNKKYDLEITRLNEERARDIQNILNENKNKLSNLEENIKDLQNRAEEHLKNAQAAEQIANIAHQNAQNLQNSILENNENQ